MLGGQMGAEGAAVCPTSSRPKKTVESSSIFRPPQMGQTGLMALS